MLAIIGQTRRALWERHRRIRMAAKQGAKSLNLPNLTNERLVSAGFSNEFRKLTQATAPN